MPAVVVVDDDDVVRRFTVRILEREGYAVTAFPDAADALADATLADADLIITDLTMPTCGRQKKQHQSPGASDNLFCPSSLTHRVKGAQLGREFMRARGRDPHRLLLSAAHTLQESRQIRLEQVVMVVLR